MLEDQRAILLIEVLIEPQAKRCSRQHVNQRCLAHGERITPKIVAVELDQVEGI
jgi:hypothetical protein